MKRAFLWLVLVAAAAVAIATVAIPTLYIQPFKPQQADMLARAYALRRAAPLVTAVCLPIVVLTALALVWGGTLRATRRTEVLRHSSDTEVLRHSSDTEAPRHSSGTEVPRHSSDTEAPRHSSDVGQGFSPARQRRRALRVAFPVLRGLSLVALVGLTSLVTWFCRQNHFEWMFAPPAEVKYVSAADASRFLTGDEMVMGIEVNGLSLAYPVRQMAYHHVVNDMFGTTPVVVTY